MENNNRSITTHHDLDLWKASLQFVAQIYKLTRKFPKEEQYALSIQLRRAGISVCSNIAEGAARGYKKEFIHFLHIAKGSVSEIEAQLEVAVILGYLKSIQEEREMIKRIRMMLLGLIRKLNT